MTLHLREINFPNGTIDFWPYSGLQKLNEVIFAECHLQRIGKKSLTMFDSLAVKNYHFKNFEVDEIDGDTLESFEMIDSVYFHNVTIHKMGSNFFHSKMLSSHVQSIHLSYFPDNLIMDDLFENNIVFWKLIRLYIRCRLRNFRVIAPSNFSKFPAIQQLDMSDCGIVIILDNSFDSMYGTLENLQLKSNKLVEVPYAIMQILDRIDKPRDIMINLYMVPFVCSCDFYALKTTALFNLQILAKSSFLLHSLMFCIDDFDKNAITTSVSSIESIERQCGNTQTMSDQKLCAKGLNLRNSTYARFVIKLDLRKENVIIRSFVPHQYRLWIYSFTRLDEYISQWGNLDHLCLKKEFVESAFKCLILKNETEVIAATWDGHRTSINIICVSYVMGGPKRFWPMHCISYFILPDGEHDGMGLAYFIVLIIFSVIGGIGLGLVFVQPCYAVINSLSFGNNNNSVRFVFKRLCAMELFDNLFILALIPMPSIHIQPCHTMIMMITITKVFNPKTVSIST